MQELRSQSVSHLAKNGVRVWGDLILSGSSCSLLLWSLPLPAKDPEYIWPPGSSRTLSLSSGQLLSNLSSICNLNFSWPRKVTDSRVCGLWGGGITLLTTVSSCWAPPPTHSTAQGRGGGLMELTTSPSVKWSKEACGGGVITPKICLKTARAT